MTAVPENIGGPKAAAADEWSAYRQTVLADNPTSYWRLADNGSAASDEQGRAGGVLEGGITERVSGPFQGSSAMRFDGQPCTGISLNSAGSLYSYSTKMALEAWVHGVTGDSYTVFRHRGNGYWLSASPGGETFTIYHVGNAAASIRLDDGQWHHLVGTADGQTVRIFVDG